MRPIIFLDFDGVLNNYDSDDDWTFETVDRGVIHACLDVACVRRLIGMINELDADVVVSSAWRKLYHHNVLSRMLCARVGLRGDERLEVQKRFISSTPDLGSYPQVRRDEILFWHNTKGDGRPYVVIDDCHIADCAGFVRTPPKTGLTDEHVAEVKEKLDAQRLR